jgi:hypothetical protein
MRNPAPTVRPPVAKGLPAHLVAIPTEGESFGKDKGVALASPSDRTPATGQPVRSYLAPWVIRRASVVVTIGAAAAIIVLIIALVHREMFATGLSAALQPKERADILASGRDFGLKLAAGLGAVTGAILAWGRLELANEEREVARLVLAGQLATIEAQRLTSDVERFAGAVDQMGSENGPYIVLGGLYALEALATSAVNYQSQITELLSAFVREQVRDRPLRPLTVIEVAALTILGRNPAWRGRIDLNGADLAGGKFGSVNFSGANLTTANLTDAELIGASLVGVKLSCATLVSVNLADAILTNADFVDADLSGAVLINADLAGAKFVRAKLTNAELANAKFGNATFMSADLTGAQGPVLQLFEHHGGRIE